MRAIWVFVLLLGAWRLEAQTNELIPVLNCGEHSYTNARITLASPAYAVVTHAGGVAQINWTNLPTEYQQRYGYDPADAEKFLAEKKQKEREARAREAAYERAAAAPAGPEETIYLTAILDDTSYGGIPLCSVGGNHTPGTVLVKNMPGPVSDVLHRCRNLKADISAAEMEEVTVTAQATRGSPGRSAKAANKAAAKAMKAAQAERKVEIRQMKQQLSELERSLKQNATVRAYPTGQSWSGYGIWVCTGLP